MKQTKKRLCASCLKFNFNKTIKSNNKQKPKWLNKIDYVEQFVNNYKNFNINYPKQIDKHLKLFVDSHSIVHQQLNHNRFIHMGHHMIILFIILY